jgi:hypothetical protein
MTGILYDFLKKILSEKCIEKGIMYYVWNKKKIEHVYQWCTGISVICTSNLSHTLTVNICNAK